MGESTWATRKSKLHKRLAENIVNLSITVNRITDRHEGGFRVSAGDMAHARRLQKFIAEDLQEIEDTSP